MRHSWTLSLVVLTLVAAGCSGQQTRSSPSLGSSAPSSSDPASASGSPSSSERRPLPSGFPVLPGAVPIALPLDDPGLIALWESDQLGSAAYDFYVAALREAGYPIVGLYPGGDAALIRFSLPDGAIWQVVAHGAGGGRVAIEVRLDRP